MPKESSNKHYNRARTHFYLGIYLHKYPRPCILSYNAKMPTTCLDSFLYIYEW